MVIDPNNINPTRTGNSQGSGGTRTSGNAPAGNSTANIESNNSRDTVELSSTARDLGRIQASLQDISEVDQARVDAVKQQIADGKYTVDANKIAQAILDNDLNFLV